MCESLVFSVSSCVWEKEAGMMRVLLLGCGNLERCVPGAGWGGQRIHCRLPQAVGLGAESFSGAEFLLASSAFSSASLLEAS